MISQIFVILLTAALPVLFGTSPITLPTMALFFSTTALAVAVLKTLEKSGWKKRWQRIIVTLAFPYTWGGVTVIFIANESALIFQIIALMVLCAGTGMFYKKMKV